MAIRIVHLLVIFSMSIVVYSSQVSFGQIDESVGTSDQGIRKLEKKFKPDVKEDDCQSFPSMVFPNPSAAVRACFGYLRKGCCCRVQKDGDIYVAEPCPPPCPTESPSPSPSPKCIGSEKPQTAWVARDPHIDTYDGLRYDCQACGEFILSKSPACPKYEIQGRFYRPSAQPFSIMSDVVIEHQASPKIQISLTRKLVTPHAFYGSCHVSFFVNGVPTVILPNTSPFFASTQIITTNSSAKILLPDGMVVMVEVRSSNSAIGSCLMSMQHFIPPSADTSDIKGLLGNVDGDMNNDWFTPIGLPVPIGGDGTLYCGDHWHVQSAPQSLFTYESGLSFDTIEECGEGSWDGMAARASSSSTREQLKSSMKVWDEVVEICQGDKSCLLEGKYLGVEAAKEMIEYVRNTKEAFQKYVNSMG